MAKEVLRVVRIEERRETRGGGRVPGGRERLLIDIGRKGRGDGEVRGGRVEGESGCAFSFWEESLEGSGLVSSFNEGGRGSGRGIVGIGKSLWTILCPA